MTSKPTIIVTGCSSGIGAYCIGRLRDDGWAVVASARKDDDIERLRDDGFSTFYLDYRDEASIEAFFAEAVSACGGRVDALFNNGGYTQPGAVEDLPVAALREQFEANLFGWHGLTRLAVPVMRRQGAGRIVHNSSVLGLVPVPLRGVYAASKFSLEGLMVTLRQELAGSGVHVSLIETGPMPSRIAINSLRYVEKYLDLQNTHHAAAYERRLAQLHDGGTKDPSGRALDRFYGVLSKSLRARSPRAHYWVTPQTRMAAIGRKVLPAELLYRLLATRA